MLPDYPEYKAHLRDVFHQRVEHAKRNCLGVFSEVPMAILHEGDRCVLFRDDGSSSSMRMERHEASVTLMQDKRNLEELDGERILAVLDELGENLAKEQVAHFIRRLDEAVEEVGNVVTGPGPSAENFLACFEKIEVPFDDQGNPNLDGFQFLVGSDETAQRIRNALDEIESTPALMRRYRALLDAKRRQWRDREAARNLVG